LNIQTDPSRGSLSYQSSPVRLEPVPPIDSVYYEKRVLSQIAPDSPTAEGCQVYLSTHDPENSCRYFRWEYTETWEIQIPYNVPNNRCWVTENSHKINIISTLPLAESVVERYPINFITNSTDRLKIKYSIVVDQYSINEAEYEYWFKLQNIVEKVGSLYDIVPASFPNNITCVEKPDEHVLGYFSVSAVKSKRIFINEYFRGMPNMYRDCENVRYSISDSIPDLNKWAWIIITDPPFIIVTYFRGCADCTERGVITRPDFWPNY